MSDKDRYELKIAGLLHDCGKVTTPVHVVDKATKLQTIYDRIHTVDTRFEVVKRDAEIEALKAILAGEQPGGRGGGAGRKVASDRCRSRFRGAATSVARPCSRKTRNACAAFPVSTAGAIPKVRRALVDFLRPTSSRTSPSAPAR